MYRVNKRMRIINMTKDGKYTPSNGRDEHINQLLKKKKVKSLSPIVRTPIK